MAILDLALFTFEKMVSLPECKAKMGSFEQWEWPCGLRVFDSDAATIESSFWGSLQEAHRLHHALGHKDTPVFTEVTTTSPDLLSVTMTFGCGCKE